MRPLQATLSLAVMTLAVQACSTTYVGRKLPTDGSQPAGDAGVPYTLTRHEFTLKIAPDPQDATKPVFTLARSSVPDANQRYSLALSPGFLTDGTMTYNFGALGNLGNAEASTTSQVVATIKAAAGFAANVIGALKDETDVWTRFRSELQKPNACKNGSGVALANYEAGLDAAAKKKFLDADKDGAERAKAVRAVLNKRAAFVADRFHYRTSQEKACLEAVQTAFGQDELTTEKDAYDAAITAAATNTASAQAVKDLKELVANKREPDTVAAKTAALDAKADPALKNAYEKAQAYLTGVQSNKLAAKLAQFYADMPLDVWRARRLAQIESDLEKARFGLQLLEAYAPKKDAHTDVKVGFENPQKLARRQISLLEVQRDQLVDAPDLKRRIAAIDVLLNSGKTGDGEGRAQLSTDRDRLQGLWDQARADLLAKNQIFDLAGNPKAPKIEAKDNVPVVLVDESYLKRVKDGTVPVDLTRKFVVVMRRLPSPTPMRKAEAIPAAGK